VQRQSPTFAGFGPNGTGASRIPGSRTRRLIDPPASVS
jgi:hypothetical protein